MTALPALVVEKDKRLQKATDDLAQLRWHWTLDESNAERVPLREYARQVGAALSTIQASAKGYAAFTADRGAAVTPGQPQSLSDHIELAKISEEKQEAVKAVAKATGANVSDVARHKREEVADVISTARERAIDRGTKVEHEIERAAEWREKARRTAEREQDDRKAAHTMRYVEIEGHIGAAMQRLRRILDAGNDVNFTSEERELLVDSLAKMRALLNLIDIRIAGETEVNWDAELAKLAL